MLLYEVVRSCKHLIAIQDRVFFRETRICVNGPLEPNWLQITLSAVQQRVCPILALPSVILAIVLQEWAAGYTHRVCCACKYVITGVYRYLKKTYYFGKILFFQSIAQMLTYSTAESYETPKTGCNFGFPNVILTSDIGPISAKKKIKSDYIGLHLKPPTYKL